MILDDSVGGFWVDFGARCDAVKAGIWLEVNSIEVEEEQG